MIAQTLASIEELVDGDPELPGVIPARRPVPGVEVLGMLQPEVEAHRTERRLVAGALDRDVYCIARGKHSESPVLAGDERHEATGLGVVEGILGSDTRHTGARVAHVGVLAMDGVH